MSSAVVRGLPKYEGPGEHFLSYDAAAGGYVCWLKGNDIRPHVLTLHASVAIHSIGDERRLALSLPRATESSLRLIAPGPHLEASLLAGEGIAAAHPVADDKTEISVLGVAGEMQLAWRPARETTAKGRTQLDANGEIVVRIESEHRVTSDAQLRVQSYGAALETFRVRLPPGMELVPLPPGGGFTVTPSATPLGDGASARNAQAQQIVEVRSIGQPPRLLKSCCGPSARQRRRLSPCSLRNLKCWAPSAIAEPSISRWMASGSSIGQKTNRFTASI